VKKNAAIAGVEKDAARALEMYTRAADAGDASAMFHLGIWHLEGK
jgi:TPR repeat protein